MVKGRRRRRIEWERLMGLQAWKASELAPKLGLSTLSTHRYLRRYYEARRLDRQRDGRYLYYVVARFLNPPDKLGFCPDCKGMMNIYEMNCGCKFLICEPNLSHSSFSYCEKHIIGTDRTVTKESEVT